MEKEQNTSVLTPADLDVLGEILNISMGASATAISTMLDKQVVITTPKLEMKKSDDLEYKDLEPALIVKIKYVEGLHGANVMLFHCRDMHIILNLLMGNSDISSIPDDISDFDEMGISAACEVTNQMMGSAATALSELLGMAVNISTPEAFVSTEINTIVNTVHDVDPGTDVVSISFDLAINGIINTNFISIMPIAFAKEIVDQLMGQQNGSMEPTASAPQPEVAPAPAAPVAPPQADEPSAPQPAPAPAPMQPQQPAPAPAPMQQPEMAPPMQQPAYPAQQPGYPQQPYMQQPYMQQPGYPPQPYGQPQQPAGVLHPSYSVPPGYYMAPIPRNEPNFAGPIGNMLTDSPVNVKRAEFPEFYNAASVDPMNGNSMNLLMNVNLDVSVEIGRTKRKIKEITEFGSGTVIELEKQAGAPVDIVVNGQLLAHGDVVVIGDNFGVRITEIVGVQNLMDSLNKK
ncbi:MAG: flagellar motor switch protein FliN [Clostridiales bacterium]|nr:flagellar motor switch protein FliN [Clostridiales bacterium]